MRPLYYLLFFVWGAYPLFGLLFKGAPIIGTALYASSIIVISSLYLVCSFLSKNPIKPNAFFIVIITSYSTFFFMTLFYYGYSNRVAEAIKFTAFVLPAFAASIVPKKDRFLVFFSTAVSALTAAGILLSIFVFVIGRSDDGRFGSLESFHPNVVSFYLAISFFASLATSTTKRITKRLCTSLILLSLLLLSSKTTVVSIVICLVLTALLQNKESLKKKLGSLFLTISALTVVGLISFYVFLADYLSEYTAIGDGKLVYTLTGRTIIWDALFDGGYLNYIGHGISVYDLYGPQPFGNIIYSTHNELLNQIFSFGVFGGIFCLTYYTTAYRWSFKTNKILSTPFFTYIIIYSLIRSIVESPQYEFNYPLIIFSLLSACVTFKQRRPPPKIQGINLENPIRP